MEKPARLPRRLSLILGTSAPALPVLALGTRTASASTVLRTVPTRSVTYSGRTVPATNGER